MPIKTAPLPVTGLPAEQLEKELRVDFDPTGFEALIEIKGYRLVWQRAAFCPCKPNNDQTKQPDPNCPICKGKGWLYFRPTGYVIPTDEIGDLDEIQTLLVNQADAVVIRGILTNMANQPNPYDKLGNWSFGDSQVTTRYQNKLGYYDRLTHLDSLIVYSEVLTVGKVTQANLKTRYPIVEINLIRSIDDEFDETDLDVVGGEIVWKPNKAPKAGTLITIHYHCHPSWLVIQHPHAIRSTFVTKKLKKPPTPVGAFTELAVQCLVKYEFLV